MYGNPLSGYTRLPPVWLQVWETCFSPQRRVEGLQPERLRGKGHQILIIIIRMAIVHLLQLPVSRQGREDAGSCAKTPKPLPLSHKLMKERSKKGTREVRCTGVQGPRLRFRMSMTDSHYKVSRLRV